MSGILSTFWDQSKGRDSRHDGYYPRPFDVVGDASGLGDWTVADGDFLVQPVAATRTANGITITAAQGGALGNKIRFRLALGQAAAGVSVAANNGTINIVVSTDATTITQAEVEEAVAAARYAPNFITISYSGDGSADVAAIADGVLAGGRDFLNASKIVARTAGTVNLVPRNGADGDAVAYTLLAGQEVLIWFDKILAQGSSAEITVFGHKAIG